MASLLWTRLLVQSHRLAAWLTVHGPHGWSRPALAAAVILAVLLLTRLAARTPAAAFQVLVVLAGAAAAYAILRS